MPAAVDATLAYSVNKYDMVAGMGYLTASGNTSYNALLWTHGRGSLLRPDSRGRPT